MQPKDQVPLAEKIRPTNLDSYIGQKQVIGPDTVLFRLLEKGEISSIILWGPPGCDFPCKCDSKNGQRQISR